MVDVWLYVSQLSGRTRRQRADRYRQPFQPRQGDARRVPEAAPVPDDGASYERGRGDRADVGRGRFRRHPGGRRQLGRTRLDPEERFYLHLGLGPGAVPALTNLPAPQGADRWVMPASGTSVASDLTIAFLTHSPSRSMTIHAFTSESYSESDRIEAWQDVLGGFGLRSASLSARQGEHATALSRASLDGVGLMRFAAGPQVFSPLPR